MNEDPRQHSRLPFLPPTDSDGPDGTDGTGAMEDAEAEADAAGASPAPKGKTGGSRRRPPSPGGKGE